MRKIDIEMPYANRKLLELIEKKANGIVNTFSEMIGLSQQRINRLLIRDKRNKQFPRITDDVRTTIIEHFGLDENYFTPPPTEEEVDPYKKLFHDNVPNEKMKKLFDVMTSGNKQLTNMVKPRIPTMAMAGYLSDYVEGVRKSDCDFQPIIHQIPSYDFTMIIKGNSMEPKFEGGDEIACKRVYDIIEWGKTYVLDTTDGAVVKRIYEAGEKIRCVSYNSDEYPDFFIDKENVRGYYKVVGLVRI
jgi:phage repressor protein C with HTH and peptisase S24 domain